MPTKTAVPASKARAAAVPRLPVWLPLIAVLAVQAAASARLLRANAAYTDEALYLWAGRVEWAHLLHGTPVPPFPAFFSGCPLIYPPLGAIASGIGGLTGARVLSLLFMFGCTTLLWDATRRLYGDAAAFFAAALFAFLGPVIHLGAFATYDAMALFLLALSAWMAVRAGPRTGGTEWWIIGAACVLALANLAKYATLLFDPVVIVMGLLIAIPESGGRHAWARMARLAAFTLVALIAFYLVTAYGNDEYAIGFKQTTLVRAQGATAPLTIFHAALTWIWPVLLIGTFAVLMACAPGSAVVRFPGRSHRLLICVLAGASLLAPLEQARIHTVTSLEKHVAFGAWFAAIACGWATAEFTSRLPTVRARAAAVSAGVAFTAAVLVSGITVSTSLTQWANASRAVAALRPLLAGSRDDELIQLRAIAEYYLSTSGQWERWSNLTRLILPSGKTMSQSVGTPAPAAQYVALVKSGYFRVVELNDIHSSALEEAIATALRHDPAYQVAADGKYGGGRFTIWARWP